MAPPSLYPENTPPQCSETYLTDQLSCPICTLLLDRPLQLSCGAIVCLQCCHSWVMHKSGTSLSCPCCYSHQFDSSQVCPPPYLVVALMESLLVHCGRQCGWLVKLNSYNKHLEANCRSHYHQSVNSPSTMTLSDVLAKPTSSPVTAAEKRVAEHLVRRMLNQGSSDSKVVKIPTRGQVRKATPNEKLNQF